jgi:hypothetical protein
MNYDQDYQQHKEDRKRDIRNSNIAVASLAAIAVSSVAGLAFFGYQFMNTPSAEDLVAQILTPQVHVAEQKVEQPAFVASKEQGGAHTQCIAKALGAYSPVDGIKDGLSAAEYERYLEKECDHLKGE